MLKCGRMSKRVNVSKTKSDAGQLTYWFSGFKDFLGHVETISCHLSYCRVRFLLGSRHGEFKFLPPPGYAPCYEAVLPREKLKLEPSQDQIAARDLLGPTITLSQAAFTPTPVDTSQVQTTVRVITTSEWSFKYKVQ